jgi:outer membrane protein assembly factor BamB
MKKLALLLLFVSLSFPSLIWQFSTAGAVTATPLVFQGMLVVPSDDGNVYALQPATGAKIWQANVGQKPNEALSFDNAVVVSTTGGRITKLDRNGKQLWSVDMNGSHYNASYVYGASANAKEVFVSASNGIYSIASNGTARLLVSFPASLVTAPAAGTDYVLYGIGNTLYKLSDTGGVLWTATTEEGSFLPAAAMDKDTVYVGALDDRMHAYAANGVQLWQLRTRDWVMSTPLVSGGIVYFGSNDGRVYAVDAGTGVVDWMAQTELAVQTQPALGTMGGRNVIFVGSTDKSIYALDTSNGEILWKGSADGGVGSPLFYQGLAIFGSRDRNVYAYSTERACSIISPVEANVLGRKEVAVSGMYASSAGGASVEVNVNNKGWNAANASGDSWVYYLDPSAMFNPGLNTLACMVVDSGGQETGQKFTNVAVNFDPTTPPSTLVMTATPNRLENVPFTIYINDGDDGSPVNRFTMVVDGKAVTTQNANNSITLQLPAGTHSIVVKKIGFNDAATNISVASTGLNPIYVVVGVVLILVILWRAWSSFSASRRKTR